MVHHKARWSSGLRLRPLTPATRVRISYGSPIVGADGGGGTPVPIPNTAVKPTCVEDTWLEAARENRQTPTSKEPAEFFSRFFCKHPEVKLLPGLVPYVEKSRKAA